MHVADIMTPSPAVILPDTSIAEAATLMRVRNIGFLPVVRDFGSMHLEGVVTDRDLVVRAIADRASTHQAVRQCMTPSPVQTATPSTDVHELIQLMEQWQIRRVPVIDTRGRLLGVVAISDLALHVGPLEPLQIEELLARISSPSRALLDDGSVMPSTPNSVRSSRR
ncbi:MAG: hypothetical protein RLZZ621_1687 [Gemmatimonadota bacterium]|jgi:CBS domain-containing protein